MEQSKQGRGWNGHFLGFWARLNCENMPVIPASLVRNNLDDPRKIPYLLVWKRENDGNIMEAVRLTCHADAYLSSPHEGQVHSQIDGSAVPPKRAGDTFEWYTMFLCDLFK